jgi:hypothetical protein
MNVGVWRSLVHSQQDEPQSGLNNYLLLLIYTDSYKLLLTNLFRIVKTCTSLIENVVEHKSETIKDVAKVPAFKASFRPRIHS